MNKGWIAFAYHGYGLSAGDFVTFGYLYAVDIGIDGQDVVAVADDQNGHLVNVARDRGNGLERFSIQWRVTEPPEPSAQAPLVVATEQATELVP